MSKTGINFILEKLQEFYRCLNIHYAVSSFTTMGAMNKQRHA